MESNRRFKSPWTLIRENSECYVVRDTNGVTGPLPGRHPALQLWRQQADIGGGPAHRQSDIAHPGIHDAEAGLSSTGRRPAVLGRVCCVSRFNSTRIAMCKLLSQNTKFDLCEAVADIFYRASLALEMLRHHPQIMT
jgi:hypothetical protein